MFKEKKTPEDYESGTVDPFDDVDAVAMRRDR